MYRIYFGRDKCLSECLSGDATSYTVAIALFYALQKSYPFVSFHVNGAEEMCYDNVYSEEH